MTAFGRKGGRWVAAQVVLLAAIAALGPSGAVRPAHWISTLAGGFVIASGLAVLAAGLRALGRRNLTPLPEPRAEAVLVTHGIYARVRHPIYSGVMLAALGWALAWQSLPAGILAVLLPAFFAAKARNEEARLRQRFPDYARYEREVPRFVPRLRVRKNAAL